MNVMTCNIRTSGAKDGPNGWAFRKQLCADVIRAQSPDLICFQEMNLQQFDFLIDALPGYRFYAMTDGATGVHPKNCIFYRDDAYALVSAGGYWLSETPHVAGSKSWESAHVRLANWVRLRDQAADAEFRIVNTHLDNKSQLAREHQARRIVEDAQAYPEDYPQLLTGDMNCDGTNAAIEAFRSGGWHDTYGAVHGAAYSGNTFHGFKGPDHETASGMIDWIFARGRVIPLAAEVIMQSDAGRFPSDHYFVRAEVQITGLNSDS